MDNFTKIKFKDKDFEMDVSLSLVDNSIRLTQKEIALFYGTTVNKISYQINRVYKEELLPISTFRKFRIVQTENNKTARRKIIFYNLDLIVQIGLRLGSIRGKMLEKFLGEYLVEQKSKIEENNELII